MRLMVPMMVGALLQLGCGDEEGDSAEDGAGAGSDAAIAATPLAGTVGGQAWTLMSAATDAFLSEGSTEFWVDAYGEAVADPCSGFVETTLPSMILNVPRAPGEYPLSLMLNATFSLNDAAQTNLIATQGRIEVDSVTQTQITGGAIIEYDASNSVNGRFTVSVCAQ
jgi:hypothetical protein